MDPSVALPLLGAFDELRLLLGGPALYAFPWQTPAGLSYDADVDAWVAGDGSAADPDLYSLSYTGIPALWGADAESLVLTLGGLAARGDVVAVARAEYGPQLTGAFMVRTGGVDGDKYSVAGLENAPDGSAGVFVVARLKRRER